MTISDAFKKLTKSEKLNLIKRHKSYIKAIDTLLQMANTDKAKDLIEMRKGHVKQINKLIKSL